MADSAKDDVLLEAADWIVRADEEDFSIEDARKLQIWREADARHDQAYRELKKLWDDLPLVGHLAGRMPLAVNDDETGKAASSGAWGRRAAGWLAAITAVAAAIAILVLPGWFAVPSERFATDVAQISNVELEDGSIATLGPRTAITVSFSGSERRVRLEGGEVFFEVTKDRERPFIVESSNSIVRVVGTKFNVRRGGRSTLVAVVQGTVQVRGNDRGGSAAPIETLRRGDRAEIVADTSGRATVRKTSNTDDLDRFDTLAAGWRQGWLAYDNARLGDIVEDINRYYAPGVRLADQSLGELRVTASFKAAKIPEFVTSLEKPFPVTVVAQPNGSYDLWPIR